MSELLTQSPAELTASAKNFLGNVDFAAEAPAAEAEYEAAANHEASQPEADIESSWADDEKSAPKAASNPAANKTNTPGQPSQTIKFKANGEDIEISLEEAQKKLSLAEGARQALQDRAKLRKEMDQLKKQAQELSKYKETWDKLETVKHDRKQLVELITGESYDDFIKGENQRRDIHQYGTEEQKQLLDYADKVQKLERERQLEDNKSAAQLKQAEQAKFDAEQQRVKNAMDLEFNKHELPEGLDNTAQSKLRKMLWNQSRTDLIDYYQQYGKVTQKMVEKAFADNAAALFRTNAKVTETAADKARAVQKKEAREQAQEDSVTAEAPTDWNQLAKLNPTQLFEYFKKGKTR